jgi:hypothetical protein
VLATLFTLALSPAVLVALILATTRHRSAPDVPFTVGAVIAGWIATAVVVVLVGPHQFHGTGLPAPWGDGVDLVVGLVVLGLALARWWRRTPRRVGMATVTNDRERHLVVLDFTGRPLARRHVLTHDAWLDQWNDLAVVVLSLLVGGALVATSLVDLVR